MVNSWWLIHISGVSKATSSSYWNVAPCPSAYEIRSLNKGPKSSCLWSGSRGIRKWSIEISPPIYLHKSCQHNLIWKFWSAGYILRMSFVHLVRIWVDTGWEAGYVQDKGLIHCRARIQFVFQDGWVDAKAHLNTASSSLVYFCWSVQRSALSQKPTIGLGPVFTCLYSLLLWDKYADLLVIHD